MLLASMLMLYMSGWLFLRQNPAAWNATLRRSAERAISSGTSLSLASIAFLAVFREGGETAPVPARARPLERRLERRPQYRPAYRVRRSVRAICGDAVACLPPAVAAGVSADVGVPSLDGAPFHWRCRAGITGADDHFLRRLGSAGLGWIGLGVNPTWEAVTVQLAVAVIAAASTLVMYSRRPVVVTLPQPQAQ